MTAKIFLNTFLVGIFVLLLCAAAQLPAFDTINLWPSTPPGDKAEDYQDKGGSYYTPRMEYWKPTKQTADACLIICCGGCYNGVAYDVEGVMPRDFFLEHGVPVVMLWYRTPRRPGVEKHFARKHVGRFFYKIQAKSRRLLLVMPVISNILFFCLKPVVFFFRSGIWMSGWCAGVG